MTPKEIEEYHLKCDNAIEWLAENVDFVVAMFDEFKSTNSLRRTYEMRQSVLTHDCKCVLDSIQKPKEVSDYSQFHLKQYRYHIRRMDDMVPVLLKAFKE